VVKYLSKALFDEYLVNHVPTPGVNNMCKPRWIRCKDWFGTWIHHVWTWI